MKKTLTILAVLIITAFTVFAATEGNTITLNSTVSAQTDYSFTLAATSATTGLDASTAGTTTFKVTSDNVMNFASNPDSIDVTVSVTPWTGTNLNETNALTLSALTATGDIVSQSGAVYSVDFEAGYKAAFEIGTFSVSWADKTTLAADSYTATVKIAYTQV